jgi:hypothetical protein
VLLPVSPQSRGRAARRGRSPKRPPAAASRLTPLDHLLREARLLQGADLQDQEAVNGVIGVHNAEQNARRAPDQ